MRKAPADADDPPVFNVIDEKGIPGLPVLPAFGGEEGVDIADGEYRVLREERVKFHRFYLLKGIITCNNITCFDAICQVNIGLY